MFADELRKNNPLVNTDSFKNHQEAFEKKLGKFALLHEKSSFAVDNGLKAINNSLYEQIKNDDVNTKFEIFNNIYYVNGAYNDNTIISMLKAYKKIVNSQDDALNFRLALIGFELSKNKHKSLYELLSDSHKAGVVGSEDLNSIISMDASAISPLSKDEIKNNCYEEISFDDTLEHKHYNFKLSPVDITFLERFAYNDNSTNLNSIKNEEQSLFASPLINYLDYLKNNVPVSVQAYVNPDKESNYLINSYLGFRNVSSSSMIDEIFKLWAHKHLSSTRLKYMGGEYKSIPREKLNAALKDIKAMASTIASEFNSANKYEGTVFRGDWIDKNGTKNYKEGQIISSASFFSTSKNISIASKFAVNNAAAQKNQAQSALMFIKLKGKSGVDISNVNKSEKEVLAMPGAKFKVTKIYDTKNLQAEDKNQFANDYRSFISFTHIDNNRQAMFESFVTLLHDTPKEIYNLFIPQLKELNDKLTQAISDYEAQKIDDQKLMAIKIGYINEINTIKDILFNIDSIIILEELDNNPDADKAAPDNQQIFPGKSSSSITLDNSDNVSTKN